MKKSFKAGSVILSTVLAVSSINPVTLFAADSADTDPFQPVYDAASGKVVVNVPEGYTVENNGADFEQVVADDFTVHQPLTDKEVKLALKITDQNGETTVSDEYALTIPGIYQESTGNAKPEVIPEIAEWYSDSTSQFVLKDDARIVIGSEELKEVGEEFQADLADLTGKSLAIITGAKEAAKPGDFYFSLESDDTMLGDEGYTMEIGSVVDTEGLTTTGVYWATRTILQTLKLSTDGLSMPYGQMRDYPKYSVRSFVFDVARKAVSMDMLEDVAKNMAWYKMNDFQVHLSDNAIFLEDYYDSSDPDPTDGYAAYSGYRLESSIANDEGTTITSDDYYYTKEEFSNFIKECRTIGINVVPEIDVPAHALAITKVFPEYASNSWNPRTTTRSIVDHLDVSKEETIDLIEDIFDDYTQDGTFDSDTIIHIGADEFESSATDYRNFLNVILPYIKKTNTVRLWGGLTWIKDNKTEISEEAISGSQINLWSKDWADGQEMYDLGFDLINTLDVYGYMVPSGTGSRGNYGDYLNKTLVYNEFSPSRVRCSDGSYVNLPSGDKQVLGGAFALWQDNIDTRASGLSEEDLFTRFFDALPLYAEKTWANGQEKGSVTAIDDLAAVISTAPNSNPYKEEESDDGIYASYDFDTSLEADDTILERDATRTENVALTQTTDGQALKLNGGSSYVETPLITIGGTGTNSLSFTLKLDEVTPGQILFEAGSAYGTHDIRITENNKLGFTRELYDYEFDYTLTAGKTMNIKIVTTPQTTSLYVDGAYVCDAVGTFTDNGVVKKSGITNSSLTLPLQRIGSKTNAVKGTIDQVVATNEDGEEELTVPTDNFVITCDNENVRNNNDGPAALAFDGDTSTIWHSNYTPSKQELPATITVDLGDTYEIDAMTYLPRQDGGNGNGIITAYKLEVSTDGVNYTQVASGTWSEDANKKKVTFDAASVRYVRFTATEGKNGFASAAEIAFVQVAHTDKTELQTVTDSYASITNEDYTEESWAAFQKAWNNAQKILTRENTTQATIDQVTEALQSAKNGLVKKEKETVTETTTPSTEENKTSTGSQNGSGNSGTGTLNSLPKKGSTYKDKKLTYKVTNSTTAKRTVTVTGLAKKSLKAVAIPSQVTINGYTYQVTAIAKGAFKKNTKLKSVTIGANVTSIGKESFKGCKNLKKVTIKSTKIKSIGKKALSGISAKVKFKLPKKQKTLYTKYLKKAR